MDVSGQIGALKPGTNQRINADVRFSSRPLDAFRKGIQSTQNILSPFYGRPYAAAREGDLYRVRIERLSWKQSQVYVHQSPISPDLCYKEAGRELAADLARFASTKSGLDAQIVRRLNQYQDRFEENFLRGTDRSIGRLVLLSCAICNTIGIRPQDTKDPAKDLSKAIYGKFRPKLDIIFDLNKLSSKGSKWFERASVVKLAIQEVADHRKLSIIERKALILAHAVMRLFSASNPIATLHHINNLSEEVRLLRELYLSRAQGWLLNRQNERGVVRPKGQSVDLKLIVRPEIKIPNYPFGPGELLQATRFDVDTGELTVWNGVQESEVPFSSVAAAKVSKAEPWWKDWQEFGGGD